MFYRRKFYIVRNEFVDIFNAHFEETNLPNQIKHGARLVGRWMVPGNESTTEIFAIWEYDSYEEYKKVEKIVRSDSEHKKRINKWYEENGGRENVYKQFILEVRNEQILSTLIKNEITTNNEVQFWLKN
ncbi:MULTISPECIES: NIPSNAP family protein [Paenibacillus]|uniref:NIPSNAP family protein n=1 Tax=Paenibacillus TaxID=44249 RepID=UPI000B84ED0A|nr:MULTISPECIES: NIPSNAP family protein [Paenibacillus]TDL67681.1 cytoplasmic protein [Paenibacillus amylolyticus]